MFAKIIDTPFNTEPYIEQLVAAGTKTVIRYYNHQNSKTFPEKRLTAREAGALEDAGISMAVVFQQRNRELTDFTQKAAVRDAERALRIASEDIGQPTGSGIYFAVDSDFFRRSELDAVQTYFRQIKDSLGSMTGPDYRIGVYGSGTVASDLLSSDLVDLVWLAGARGWSGTRDWLPTGRWHIFQDRLEQKHGRIDFDTNITPPGISDFGQFSFAASSALPPAISVDTPDYLFEVSARGALNLRGGPGQEFPVLRSLPHGMQVYGLERRGDWVRVDLSGDGVADGFVYASYLKPLTGNVRDLTSPDRLPIDVAYGELEQNVREVPGEASNPRIALYYRTMDESSHDDSEVPWCSYFVNYCVVRSGRRGTGRPNARSWLDWGNTVGGARRLGDIVIFWRGQPDGWQGHVGFYVGEDEDSILVLGGNQNDRVSISGYPKARLLGARRALY